MRVQEIRGHEPPTRITNAPEFIKGVVNLPGVIVPVVDLRMCFGVAEVAYHGLTVVIVLNIGLGTLKQGGDERMRILVDIERLMRSPDMGLAELPLH
jgi:purine-binding chemotaxis protein CheW